MTASPPADRRWDEHNEAVVAITATARLSTATKAFCSCAVDADAEPNANTCPVCLGLPGTLPVLNARAVELCARAALALGCAVQVVTSFARAHAAPTPAAPKGYLLTQRERPFGTRGSAQIGETPEGSPISAAVRCVYLTEDTARGVHGRFADASGFDYNLAGAPLLVVEGAPELRSPAEARAFVAVVARLLRDVGASAADLADGTLAVTAHVALRGRGDLKAGEACEVEGARSLDALEQAVEAECARQAAVLGAGNTVDPRRLLWVDGTLTFARARRAEPWTLADPDLPPLLLTNDWVAARRAELPELAPARRERLRRTYQLDEELLDVLDDEPELAGYYESVARLHGDAPAAARWVRERVLPLLGAEGLSARAFAVRVRPADLVRLLDLRRAGTLSDADAGRVFTAMARTGDGVQRAAEREGVRLDPSEATA